MRKAYSYIRMSTDVQLKGDSLRRQLEQSSTYALENDLELIDSIDGNLLRDIGVSGFKGKNSQSGILAIFLKKLELNEIEKNSVLLIESLDRLSRDDVVNALTQFLNIINFGIEIVTLADNQRYTRENINSNVGSLYMSLGIMFRANEESQIKSKRIKAAWANKRKNALNKPLTSLAPAWLKYNQESKEFEIINERAETVKTIFHLCINTCGLWAITKYLNTNLIAVFGKSKFWHKSYVRKIISNRSVLGEFQPHSNVDGIKQAVGDPIKHYYPQIITEEEFLLANAAIEKRTKIHKGRKGTNFSNIFSGLVYCGICNSKMILRNRGLASKGGKCLICSNKLVSAGCNMPEWKLTEFENLIFSHLKEIDFSELIGNQSETSEIENKIYLLESLLQNQLLELDNAITFTIENNLNDVTRNRYIEIINNLEEKVQFTKIEILDNEMKVNELTNQSQLMKSNELKEMIKRIRECETDYYFRSSLNQLLSKTIDRIELKIETAEFEPWEIEENDPIVKHFHADNSEYKNLPLRELVDKIEFKEFCRTYENRVVVRYRTNVTRHIYVGSNFTLLFYKN